MQIKAVARFNLATAFPLGGDIKKSVFKKIFL